MHSRAHIRLITMSEVNEFVKTINSDGTTSHYVIENADGSLRVNARSLEGVLYASVDYNDEMYLVNDTFDGIYPNIEKFRV